MDIKRILGLSCTLLASSIASAGTMGPVATPSLFQPVFAVQGGYAGINASGTDQSYFGTDHDEFVYTNSGHTTSAGFIGVFIGEENTLDQFAPPGYFMQAGFEYNYFGPATVNGMNTVGMGHHHASEYLYSYKVQTQQVLGLVKLFATTHERFYPYGEVGLGAAFNEASKFNATQIERRRRSMNLTPVFTNGNQTQFSYILGLGVETQVTGKIRAGLGYRYSNFGSSSLGDGAISFHNYQFPVPFTLTASNAYANQLIARISYLA